MKPMEEEIIVTNTCTTPPPKPSSSLERKIRPQKVQALNCPRCNSTNTKFCYYNNYSLTQPRYFCKTCKRYWTEGGSLRNIPVGGGSRKINKRHHSSSSSSSKKFPHLVVSSPLQNPKITTNGPNEAHDLNLGFKPTNDFKSFSEFMQLPNLPCSSSSPNSAHLSALELLSGLTSRGLNSFVPMPIDDPNAVYSSGFHNLPEFKSSLSFNLDGIGGYGSQESTSGKLLFPFEDLKVQPSSTTNEVEHSNRENGDSSGYWNGMLGGGSW